MSCELWGRVHRSVLSLTLCLSVTDLEKLSTFSQRFPLPSMYRIHVWKVLLGKISLAVSITSFHCYI